MSQYPDRREGESDKQYLKRILSEVHAPVHLLERHEEYFTCENATFALLSQLHSTKSVAENEKASVNAAKAMTLAAARIVERRAPLTVRQRPDGQFDVIDGNGTLTAAKRYGWTSIPVTIEEK